MPTTVLEPQISENQKSEERDWKLHKIAKIKFYSNKRIGKVQLLNAFERHDKVSFIISALNKSYLSDSVASVVGFEAQEQFILKVRRRKDGTPFVCFYRKKKNVRTAAVNSCDPKALFDKMQEMYAETLRTPRRLHHFEDFREAASDQERKKLLDKYAKRKKEMPAIWLKRISRLVRALCKRNGISAKYMHRHPLAAIRQLMYPKSTELFSEAELLAIEVNPLFNRSIAKNVFGSQGRKSKALVKKICLMGESRGILTAIRFVRIYHGIDHAQTLAEAYLSSEKCLFTSRNLAIKIPGEKEPLKFRFDNAYFSIKPKYIRACKHYSYKEFLKMLFVATHYRQDVERNLEEYGIPQPEVHRTYVELHDHMANIRKMDGDDYGKPIPRPSIANEIEKNFAALSEGRYTIEFPDNTARLHEYGEWAKNCIYGYARNAINERSLALAVLDKDGNFNTLFGFYYQRPARKDVPGHISHRDSSQRFNKVQNPAEFKEIRKMVFHAIRCACLETGAFGWEEPNCLSNYDALIELGNAP